MKKFELGSIAIIFGGLLLSLELYLLKIVQVLERSASGEFYANAIDYVNEYAIQLALFITIAIIIYGIVLAGMSFGNKNNK